MKWHYKPYQSSSQVFMLKMKLHSPVVANDLLKSKKKKSLVKITADCLHIYVRSRSVLGFKGIQ